MSGARRKDDRPGAKELDGLLHMLENGRAKPTTALIKALHEIAIDGRKAIAEPDEFTRTVYTLVMVMQMSTELVPRKNPDGTYGQRGRISNPDGFDYACWLLHEKLRQ